MKKIVLGNDEYTICETCGAKRNAEDYSLECPVCLRIKEKEKMKQYTERNELERKARRERMKLKL